MGAAAALVLSLSCATAPVAPAGQPDSAGAARRALDRFTAAVGAGRWDEAYAALSERWRARETPARLAAELSAAGPVGRDAVRRVRALLATGSPLLVAGDVATLPVGEGRAARLVREGGGWRVDALE